jgi:transcriptional regulator with XRE-family HTH domain
MSIILLNLDKYNGAAEASTKTFAGQLEAFKISAGTATEKLGTGFLVASSYIVTGEADLKNFGIALEGIAAKVSDTFVGFGKVLSEEGVFKALVTSFKDLGEEGFKVRQRQYLQEKGYLGLSQFGIDALELQLKYGKKKLTQEEMAKKLQADILARQKAQTKEQTAQAALAKQKTKIEGMFDLEKINLQAALTRKLSGEDELRVKILQKLADGTQAAVNEAQKYADVLKVIEDGKITSAEIDNLAKTWGMTNLAVDLYLKKLFDANAELAKMRGFVVSQAPVTSPVEQPATLEQARSTAASSVTRVNEIYNDLMSKILSTNRVPLAEGGIVTRPTNALIGEAGAEAVIPLDRMGQMGNRVTVNVAGSVISEGQLQSVIQDVLYNLNRTGAVTQLANLGR